MIEIDLIKLERGLRTGMVTVRRGGKIFQRKQRLGTKETKRKYRVNYYKEDMIDAMYQGDPKLCFENARQEYLLRKEKGENVKYYVGIINTYYTAWDRDKQLPTPKEEILTGRKMGGGLAHAWVVKDGNKVIDPTHYKYGLGDYNSLPSQPAMDHFIYVEYKGKPFIDDERLSRKLFDFPTNPIWEEEIERQFKRGYLTEEEYNIEMSSFKKNVDLIERQFKHGHLTEEEYKTKMSFFRKKNRNL